MSIKELTKDNFKESVGSEDLAVVDFWAGWCGPCRAMAPQFEKAAEMRPQYTFGKVNVDEQPELAGAFGVQSIPTLAVLRNGELVGTAAGLVGADQLVDALDKISAQDPPAAG